MNRILKSEQDQYEKREWTRIINCLSGFKSANLVATRDQNGVSNLSMISSCFHLGASPPLMGFIQRPHSNKSPRHTLMNIKDSGFYSINHITEDFYKRAHQSSARYPMETSEFDLCGLTEEYKEEFGAPFVAESPLQIGLELKEVLDIQQNNTHLVIGEVQVIYVEERAYRKDGFLDLEAIGSLCCSGLDSYHKTQRLARLSYAKPNEEVKELSLDGE